MSECHNYSRILYGVSRDLMRRLQQGFLQPNFEKKINGRSS